MILTPPGEPDRPAMPAKAHQQAAGVTRQGLAWVGEARPSWFEEVRTWVHEKLSVQNLTLDSY